MNDELKDWISKGAVPPAPEYYDYALICNLARKHDIRVLFYMGDINDRLLTALEGKVDNIVVLNKKLDVSVKGGGSKDFVNLDFNFIYRNVQGDRIINFIDYCPAYKDSFSYIVETLWKSCSDGSAYVVKGAKKFLADTDLDLEEIQVTLNSCSNREYYKVAIELDMIMIEKG
jgi:hypothetical protein